eukprot:1147624-Pelagomonas_calceolata.AAC.1
MLGQSRGQQLALMHMSYAALLWALPRQGLCCNGCSLSNTLNPYGRQNCPASEQASRVCPCGI